MAGKNNKNQDDNLEYDAFQESIRYGTIETTPLFENDNKSFKFSSGGGTFNLRIRWASIIGAAILGFLALGIMMGLYFLFGAPLLMIPFIVAVVLASILAGGRLGRWSPMEKTTGEDLTTYIMIKLRQRLSTNGSIIGGGRPSKVQLNSMAISKGSGGRIVDCDVYLGTQPMFNAPPINPYDFNEMTEFHLVPRGEFSVLPNDRYKDGLGERF